MALKNPILSNPIAVDIPKLNEILDALSKANPTDVDGISTGAMRLYEVSSGKWQWQEYNGSSWAAVPFLQHNVDQLDGYHATITPAANTVAVRNASGLLQDSITGNAATASSAATLSQTLPVNKGGTGATTSEAARSNLGVPPTSHASTNTTHGVGNATQYGHLKLSDAANSSSGVSGGVAATPAAVKAAKDAADAAQSSANNAQSSADAAMTKASTLATSSTPGIVKPGTGMTVDAAGALNVTLNNTVTSTSTTQAATANAVKTTYDKAMDAAAAAQQAADDAQKTADQAISAAGSAGNVSLISQRSTTGQWSITGLDVGKPLYITVSSSTNRGHVFFCIKSGSLDGISTSNELFQFGRYDPGNWVSLTPPGTVIIPTSTKVIVDIAGISNMTLRAYQ